MSSEGENKSPTASKQKNERFDIVKQLEAPLVRDAHNKEAMKGSGSSSQWTKVLMFAGYASTFGSAVPAGYCVGVVNSPAVHMRLWCNETLIERYDLHLRSSAIDILWAMVVSIFLVGGAVGSLTGAWVANRLGRKTSLFWCGVLLLIGAALFATCRWLGSVEMLLIGRFVVGLGAGLTTTCLPMYLNELAPLALRGALAVFCPMGLTGGVVLGQIFSLQSVFGSAGLWHVALSFYVILVVLCYAPWAFYPESPKWLYIVRGEKEQALEELKRLRGITNLAVLASEIDEMELEANVKDQMSSFKEVLGNSSLMLPLVIVCAYQGGQQLSGINAIFYYSVSIFRRAGLSTAASEWANLGAGSLNLAVSLLGPLLMAKVNRRFLMLFSSFFCALFLLSFALMLYFIDLVSWFAVGCILCIFLYIFFFQFGIGPIPFFIGAELFEVAPRSVAMSLGSVSSWTCNFIVGMAFPSLQNAWGSLVFLPFSITCALLFILTKFYLPETRGRDPCEVAPLVADGFKSKVL